MTGSPIATWTHPPAGAGADAQHVQLLEQFAALRGGDDLAGHLGGRLRRARLGRTEGGERRVDVESGRHRRTGVVPGPQHQVGGDLGADDTDRAPVAGGAGHVGVLPDRVDAGGGLPQRQVDDQPAHAVAGRLMADVGPLGGLGAASIQRPGVQPRERPADAGPELGDGQLARRRAEPGPRSRRRPSAWPDRAGRPGPASCGRRCGPRTARSRCRAASWSAGSTRRQRLGLDLRAAADQRQLGHERLGEVGQDDGLPVAASRAPGRRSGPNSSVALDASGAGRSAAIGDGALGDVAGLASVGGPDVGDQLESR